MAFNELGNSAKVLAGGGLRGGGSLAAVLMPCNEQRVVALKGFAAGELKLAPSAQTKHLAIPKPGAIIKGGEQSISVKLNGSVFGTKLSTIVTAHAPSYSRSPAENQEFVNAFWLVRWTDNPKIVNMKSMNEPIEVGGLTVMCPTLVNTKDIAAGDQLFVKAVKTFA